MNRIPDRYYPVFVGVVVGTPLLVALSLLFYSLGSRGSVMRVVGFVGFIIALSATVILWLHYLDTTGRPGGFR